MNKEELFRKIKNFSRNDNGRIILGDILELRISEDGENLDVYKYTNLDNVNIEEYDFDGDYITSIYLK
jgi:hypothetical protein